MNVSDIRSQFPSIDNEAFPETYLDSAATTLKPKQVTDCMNRFSSLDYGTVHRGLYKRNIKSTELFENARETVASFINSEKENLVFTAGTTDSINLVAWSFGRAFLKKGDKILITDMEHHSNIVPWQLVAENIGCELIHCPIFDDGSLDIDSFKSMLDEKVKIVSIMHVSNALGTINPVKELVKIAHDNGSKVLIDGAQSTPHMPVDVKDIDCDFFAFSAHKVYGPTGIGALYGKTNVLESMPPFKGGGNMIEKVSFEKTTYAPPPAKFEAGTPPIVEAIGFAEACSWLNNIGMDFVHKKEIELYKYLEEKISEVTGLTVLGSAENRGSLISFTMQDAHPSDISNILDMNNVSIRSGHHCAQPLMNRFGVPATARISLGVYNTKEDIDNAIIALKKVAKIFGLS